MTPGGARGAASTTNPWVIVALLAAALFINYVDRGTLPTAAPLIQDEFGFGEHQLGRLLSAFFWSYALLQIPIGWVAERYGAQRVLALGLALWACATLLVGAAHSFTTLFMLRLLLGIGESAGFPCVSKLLAATVPAERLGAANGVVAFGYLFGPAVGVYCGGLLMAQFGWRATFWVFGGLSLLWLLPWARVRLPPAARAVHDPTAPTYPEVLRQRALWGTSLGHFSGNYTFYFLLTWLPYYLMRERGFSMEAMVTTAGQAFTVNALTALVAGWAIDRVGARRGDLNLPYKLTMGFAHLGTVACMLCLALGSTPVAVASIFVLQVLSGLSSPGTFAIPQICAGPKAAARWVGTQNCIANLAGIIAPELSGFLAERTHHFTSACVVGAVVAILGLVGWVVIVPRVAPVDWGGATHGRAPS
ncbi:MAG TPA: MFS transporter [Steroidobacteraceae bacterium]|nr:MFS transporter [Steroidobacteraceae bacterium]